MIAKAARSEADAVCIDLEDAVYAPLGTGGSGFVVGDVLAFQYLYRDNSAPNGARYSDAVAFTITP